MPAPVSGWAAGAAPWIASYPAGVPATYPYPGVPLCRLLDDAAQDFPDVMAIEYRGYRMTYRKLLDHVDRFATALSGLGVGAGDRVAVVLPTCPQLVIALFASWRIGATVALQRSESAAAAAPAAVVALDRSDAVPLGPAGAGGSHSIITGRREYLPFPRNVIAPVSAALRGRWPSVPWTARGRRLADLVRRNLPAPAEPDDAVDLDALAMGGWTVGQRRLVVNSFQLRLWLPDVVAGDERVLVALRPSVAAVLWIVVSVLSAATMILVDDGRAAQRQRTALRARPTLLPLDRRVTGDLVRSSWRRGHLRSVRIAMSHDRLDADAAQQLEQLTDKGRIRRAWGIDGLLTHAEPVYGRAARGSVGLPLPDTDAAVVDADGTTLPPGDRGHLWVRGPQLDAPRWTDARTDATLDHDGYLTIHDD